MKLSKGKALYIAVSAVIFILLLTFGFCPKAKAADPIPPKGEWFVAASAIYTTDFGAGAGFGYQFKDTGVIISPMVTYTYAPSFSGVVPFKPYWSTYQVPYTVSGEGTVGYQFSVLIPIRVTKK